MQRTLRGVLVIAGLAVVALTACGGDDDDGSATTAEATETTTQSGDGTSTASTGSTADASEADYLAALERSLGGAETGQVVLSSEQAECVAPKWLDTIGVDRLKERGIDPVHIGDDIDDDGSALSDVGLTEDEGHALYDAFVDCGVDIEQQFLAVVTDDLTEEAAACVTDAVSGDLLRRLHVSVLVHGDAADELQAEIGAAVAPCEGLQQGETPTTSG